MALSSYNSNNLISIQGSFKKRYKFVIHLLVLAISFISSFSADAELLCARKKINAKNKKSFYLAKNLIKSVSTCPSGYETIADTSTFKGPKGDKGNPGTNGVNGSDTTDSLSLNNSSCRSVEKKRVSIFNSDNQSKPENFTADCDANELALYSFYKASEKYSSDFQKCEREDETTISCGSYSLANKIYEFESPLSKKSEHKLDTNNKYIIGVTKEYQYFSPGGPYETQITSGNVTVTEIANLTCCAYQE